MLVTWINDIVSLCALILLEIVLGIDNVVFLSILTKSLPRNERKIAVRWGLVGAWGMRVLMLASAVWLTKLTTPFYYLGDIALSFDRIFFIMGGGFLIAKATQEIHHDVTHQQDQMPSWAGERTFLKIVIQIMMMDVIFSFDSILTAVGLTTQFWIMTLAITVAIWVMLVSSHWINDFIHRYPTLKMLSLSYLMLIGMVLIADGFSFHIPRGYVYFAMGFSLSVESLNLLRNAKRSSDKE